MDINFGDRIKFLRNRKGLSQSTLALVLGVSRTMISSYESNARKPSYENLLAIVTYFNVSMDWMFGNNSGENDSDVIHLSRYKDDQKMVFENIARAFNTSNKIEEEYNKMITMQIRMGEEQANDELVAMWKSRQKGIERRKTKNRQE